MLLSATVAENAASWLGSSSGGSAACKVSSAAVNVPYAETWESSVVCSFVSWAVCPAPNAVVSEETMALMSNPEPMPVEVIKALALDGELLEELGETTELIEFSSAR
jgi:hypothetical protein